MQSDLERFNIVNFTEDFKTLSIEEKFANSGSYYITTGAWRPRNSRMDNLTDFLVMPEGFDALTKSMDLEF